MIFRMRGFSAGNSTADIEDQSSCIGFVLRSSGRFKPKRLCVCLTLQSLHIGNKGGGSGKRDIPGYKECNIECCIRQTLFSYPSNDCAIDLVGHGKIEASNLQTKYECRSRALHSKATHELRSCFLAVFASFLDVGSSLQCYCLISWLEMRYRVG